MRFVLILALAALLGLPCLTPCASNSQPHPFSTMAMEARAVPAAQKCPTITTHCPASVSEGELLTFTAMVTGGAADVQPTFNWTVSNGSISTGQGTPVIKVDTKQVGGSTITATVEVGGYDRACPTVHSCTAEVLKPAVKVGAYGKAAGEEKAQLDRLAAELAKDESAQGYIIAYGGRETRKDEALTAGLAAIDYLIKQRKVGVTRLLPLDGGYREKLAIELWLVPSGAMPPEPTPTVDAKDVKFIKAKSPSLAKPRKKT